MKDYIVSKLDEYKAVFTDRPKRIPCDAVVDAPIAGNGDIGICLNSVDTPAGKGRPGSTGGAAIKPVPLDNAVEIYFTKNDFWKSSYGMDGKGGMKSIGRLLLIFENFGGCDYYAEQHIKDGKLTVKLTKENRSVLVTAYVPRHENLIVVKARNEGTGGEEDRAVRGKIDLAVTRAKDAEYSESFDGEILALHKSFSGPELVFPTAAAAAAKILGRRGREFTLTEGEERTIVTAVISSHDDPGYREKARAMLDKISLYRLADIHAKHCGWWKNFWLSSGIRIPSEPLVEKMWYGSHYIMASCCGNKNFPPGLFANWVTTDTPDWSGDYHLNYNYEAPWWGLYSSNKIELTEGYDTPLMEYLGGAQEAARRKLDCRGLYSLVGIGPKGFAISRTFDKNGNDDVSYWGQKSNASYAAVNMVMRFYATYDLDYARNTAYPYLKEAGAFWEDYLVFKDGRYIIYNDCIHENGYLARGVLGWGRECPDYSNDCNPLLSLGLVRMIFRALLDIRAELGDDDGRAEKWRHILEHLSPFPVQMRNGKKVFRYTETGMDWRDDNSLGVQHIFPAGALGLGSDREILEIARNTLVEMARWEDYNAFGTFFAAAVRLGHDPADILRRLNGELRKHAYDNLYIYYGGGGIECCSGVPVCVNEMLLQSHEGVLRFFPVWDKTKDAAFYNLRAYGAFLVSGELKDGTVGEIALYSEKGRRCVFQAPSGVQALYRLSGEGRKEIAPQREGEYYAFDTEAGGAYTILLS